MKNLLVLTTLSLLLTSCATSRIAGWNKIFGGKALSKTELSKEMKSGKKTLGKKR